MRRAHRTSVSLAAALVCATVVSSCDRGGSAGKPSGPRKSPASVRASLRAYDGAPPVIPHNPFGVARTSCHNATGIEVPEVGFAPPSPHELTTGMSTMSRCQQCHIFATTTEVFAANDFVGLRQDLRRGSRLYPHAPPVVPHAVFMRENCAACHTGPAAREEIRCTHSERVRCQQCHVPIVAMNEFSR